MKLPDSAIVGITLSISLSHCPATNTTQGLILCSSKPYLSQIASTILSARTLAAHPAAIPVMACDLFVQILDEKIDATWTETYKLETDSGQSGIVLAYDGTVVTRVNHPTPANPNPTHLTEEFELPPVATPLAVADQEREAQLALNTRSMGLAQLTLAWEYYTNVTVHLLEMIETFLQGGTTTSSDALISAVQEEQLFALKEKVTFLSQLAAGSALRARLQRGRLELQNTAVF